MVSATDIDETFINQTKEPPKLFLIIKTVLVTMETDMLNVIVNNSEY